jgi:ArsR family transcriptional regulator, nickel/cobalt-responsive transcriptional repressor
MQDDLQSDTCARRLRAVADADRLRIIQLLRQGPKNVGEIAAALGAEIVNVSHHLGVLRNANMVQDHKRGRYVLYQLHPDLFQPAADPSTTDHLNLGCCRIEIPRGADSPDEV